MAAPRPPQSGGFKLKIKLGGPPSVSVSASNPALLPPLSSASAAAGVHGHPVGDEEDQLASSGIEDDSGSLSSAPPPPPPVPVPPPVALAAPSTKRPKSKDPSTINRPTKKRKSQPVAAQASSAQAYHHPSSSGLPQPPVQALLMADEQDSELSSYASDQPLRQPKLKKIKLGVPSNPSKLSSKPRSRMVPLTDAELLSAAGSQIGEPSSSLPPPLPAPALAPSTLGAALKPITVKKKKKKSSTGLVPLPDQTKLNPPLIPLAAVCEPHPVDLTTPQADVPPLTHKLPLSRSLGGKAKGKKSSKPSSANNTLQPLTKSAPAPITFPPPQPRLQHDYSLGPPPPPPVPALKPFPTGPPPRPQGPFLPAQVLEKRTPKVRSWKKHKRQVIGISGIPFWIWTYVGDDQSDYALFKQTKMPQGVGTPSATTQAANYFGSVQPSRPGSAASTHPKPSPIRNSGSGSRSKAHAITIPAESTPNLGGPALPASFRRPPLSMGSPLSFKSIDRKVEDPHQSKPSSVSSRSKPLPESTPAASHSGYSEKSQTEPLENKLTGSEAAVESAGMESSMTGVIKLPELSIPKVAGRGFASASSATAK